MLRGVSSMRNCYRDIPMQSIKLNRTEGRPFSIRIHRFLTLMDVSLLLTIFKGRVVLENDLERIPSH